MPPKTINVPSPLYTAIREVAVFLGKKLDGITAAVKESKGGTSSGSNKELQQLSVLLQRIEKAVGKMQEPSFSGEITVDTKAFAGEIGGIAKEIREMAAGMKFPENDGLVKELQIMSRKLDGQPWDKVIGALNGVKTALEASAKAAKKGQVVRLEEDQLRSIRSSQASVVVGGSEALSARNVRNVEVAMTDADTEYSYTFPANTVSWRLKLRAVNAKLLYSWASGTLPGGAGTDAYMTLPQNFLDSRDGVEFSGKTIYLQSPTAAQVAEIEVYTA